MNTMIAGLHSQNTDKKNLKLHDLPDQEYKHFVAIFIFSSKFGFVGRVFR